MGVRGLTSYIARHAELYLKPHELHDCNLVIDGDNLSCNLYRDAAGAYTAFGGDYDAFYRAVVNFFHVLAECNIQAYVLMDGGYEERKLRTVGKRLRGKIAAIKRINPNGCAPVFPILMKEVFVDAVRDCGVPVMRCVFEADDELAALGRKLRCPVLSYDSDFYIHNVRYIPLVTLTLKAHTKQLKSGSSAAKQQRKLRKNEARCMEKRSSSHHILDKIEVNDVEQPSSKFKGKRTYKYLDCCMYRVKNLVARGTLSEEKLPLFAALLGNDYIARSAFKGFFQAGGMGKAGRSKTLKQQQRKIHNTLQWLRHESSESALRRILARLKKTQRASLLAQVESAICGYSNEKCRSYDFFVQNYANAFKEFIHDSETEEQQSASETDEFEKVEEESEQEQANSSENEIEAEENETEELQSASETNEFEKVEEESEQEQANSSENEVEAEDNDKLLKQMQALSIDGKKQQEAANGKAEEQQPIANTSEHAQQYSTDEDDDNDNSDDDAEKAAEPDIEETVAALPAWFLNKLYAANLPRFCVDLMFLRKYINGPQIEHFPHNDAHQIALPILIYNFTLLYAKATQIAAENVAEKKAGEQQTNENSFLENVEKAPNVEATSSSNEVPEFVYITRLPRVSQISYDRHAINMQLIKNFNYNPLEKCAALLQNLYHQNLPHLNVQRLFEKLGELPSELQLYFLAIVYWLHKSPHCDLLHLHALLICAVVLRTIDAQIPAERNIKAFHKRFDKIIKRERLIRAKVALEQGNKPARQLKPELQDLSILERMRHIPKSDCYLVKEKLLKNFHMQEVFKKKYDEFSTSILHAFAEFQALVFQLHALNTLLEQPLAHARMGQLYCGVFLYNIYDLLRMRIDVQFYVQNFIFQDSPLMFEFYTFLYDWCVEFVPHWKRQCTTPAQAATVHKKLLKKQRQKMRKQAQIVCDPQADMLDNAADSDEQSAEDEIFYDENNAFSALLAPQKLIL